MDSNYTFSSDGAKIAYSITGQGAPLLLVHGSGHSKELWQTLGWMEAFQNYFTTIAIDIRGNGDSDKSLNHFELVTKIDTCFPWVIEQLMSS